MNIATEFIFINSASDLYFFHNFLLTPNSLLKVRLRVIMSSACIKQRQYKFEWMFTILTGQLSSVLASSGNTFELKKRLRVWTMCTASNLCNSV